MTNVFDIRFKGQAREVDLFLETITGRSFSEMNDEFVSDDEESDEKVARDVDWFIEQDALDDETN